MHWDTEAPPLSNMEMAEMAPFAGMYPCKGKMTYKNPNSNLKVTVEVEKPRSKGSGLLSLFKKRNTKAPRQEEDMLGGGPNYCIGSCNDIHRGYPTWYHGTQHPHRSAELPPELPPQPPPIPQEHYGAHYINVDHDYQYPYEEQSAVRPQQPPPIPPHANHHNPGRDVDYDIYAELPQATVQPQQALPNPPPIRPPRSIKQTSSNQVEPESVYGKHFELTPNHSPNKPTAQEPPRPTESASIVKPESKGEYNCRPTTSEPSVKEPSLENHQDSKKIIQEIDDESTDEDTFYKEFRASYVKLSKAGQGSEDAEGYTFVVTPTADYINGDFAEASNNPPFPKHGQTAEGKVRFPKDMTEGPSCPRPTPRPIPSN
ncbi:uncharacterized protein LOC117301314 isoform X2 [Asterias rubens]|uniref:uncharacterized protein LOC117301314 isoform X2 n=1 Tax=Asterias rubens TaxID=7604 RepID=UPI001455BFB6|nr:uncharacterized protein LOC117301314 isoform X2 [Asterias rubens]